MKKFSPTPNSKSIIKLPIEMFGSMKTSLSIKFLMFILLIQKLPILFFCMVMEELPWQPSKYLDLSTNTSKYMLLTSMEWGIPLEGISRTILQQSRQKITI